MYLLHRCWCAGRSHVRGGWTRWLVLPEHSGAVGPSGQTVELCRTDVHSPQHSWCRRFRQQVSILTNLLVSCFNILKFKFNREADDVLFVVVFQKILCAGFPSIREIRENFEDFFQSGKSGKNRGFSAKIREKNFRSGNFFPNHFQTF